MLLILRHQGRRCYVRSLSLIHIFLASGAKVYFLGKPGEDLTKQTEELKSINPDYDFASNTIDLCDYKAAQALYAEIEEKWGRLDVLVNNAGVDSSLPIHKMKQSQWDYVMNVNLKGMFNLTKYAIKYLKKTKGCIAVSYTHLVSEDFPIVLRISGSERIEGGNSLEEMLYLAPKFEAAGVNMLEVSGGVQYLSLIHI